MPAASRRRLGSVYRLAAGRLRLATDDHPRRRTAVHLAADLVVWGDGSSAGSKMDFKRGTRLPQHNAAKGGHPARAGTTGSLVGAPESPLRVCNAGDLFSS